MFTLKMVDDSNSSDSILVPFNQKCEAALRENHIKVVFRKRGPKSFTPQHIFVYIGAPASQLIGLLEIESFEFLSLSDALLLAESGGLTEAELRKYAANYDELAVFRVKSFQAAPKALSLNDLASQYGFYPPQSFLRLSQTGHDTLVTSLGCSVQQKNARSSKR